MRELGGDESERSRSNSEMLRRTERPRIVPPALWRSSEEIPEPTVVARPRTFETPEATRVAESSDIPRPRELPGKSAAAREFFRNREARFTEAVSGVKEAAQAVLRDLADEVPAPKLDSFIENVNVSCDFLTDQLRALLVQDGETQSQAVSSMALAMQSLQTEVTEFQHELNNPDGVDQEVTITSPHKTAGFARILQRIRKAMGYLWDLISGLLKPKEWSIKGELKAIPFLAKAEVEIRFGP
ncbi:hypothetical protein GA0070607_2306 [Micromonospora coriariae]|uniref:Uncharacterized protein n=1 Tax=Micromonospora coriariae TaxID=285665 RepID=A0A1C4VL68_9ACTN|nr:hypothetical protein [Micromonospora coriariae]SCE84752.1 hypothetical protein GA0070607_2306 [Micromonospora coriariae]